MFPEDSIADDDFGRSVGISGNAIVVGAPLRTEESPMVQTGAAYVFERSGGTWTQQTKLLRDAPSTGDKFGLSVAIDGKTLVVGGVEHATVFVAP